MYGAIHEVTINSRGVGTPDAEGRGGTTILSSTTVWGRVLFNKSSENEKDGRYSEDLDLIVALPTGTVIHVRDQIALSNIDSFPSTGYEVMEINDAQAHLEVGCRVRGVD